MVSNGVVPRSTGLIVAVLRLSPRQACRPSAACRSRGLRAAPGRRLLDTGCYRCLEEALTIYDRRPRHLARRRDRPGARLRCDRYDWPSATVNSDSGRTTSVRRPSGPAPCVGDWRAREVLLGRSRAGPLAGVHASSSAETRRDARLKPGTGEIGCRGLRTELGPLSRIGSCRLKPGG